MYVIGLVGGIASGKSAVAKELANLGAVVLDADKAAHESLNLPKIREILVDRWGEDILLEDGQMDRSQIAARVFDESPSAKVELRFLEQTLHPEIRSQFEAELRNLEQHGVETAVIDAPLLLEAGWANLCNSVIYVDTPYEHRLDRALRRNWTAEHFATREASQMPIEEKKRLAEHVIVNSGTLPELTSQVQQLWPLLRPDAGKT